MAESNKSPGGKILDHVINAFVAIAVTGTFGWVTSGPLLMKILKHPVFQSMLGTLLALLAFALGYALLTRRISIKFEPRELPPPTDKAKHGDGLKAPTRECEARPDEA